ncbi:hypothetical protein GGI35DRAFT_369992 [Trichoderma velutinum]
MWWCLWLPLPSVPFLAHLGAGSSCRCSCTETELLTCALTAPLCKIITTRCFSGLQFVQTIIARLSTPNNRVIQHVISLNARHFVHVRVLAGNVTGVSPPLASSPSARLSKSLVPRIGFPLGAACRALPPRLLE